MLEACFILERDAQILFTCTSGRYALADTTIRQCRAKINERLLMHGLTHLHYIMLAHKDICRLNVPVNDIVLMQVLQALAHLNEVLPNHFLH